MTLITVPDNSNLIIQSIDHDAPAQVNRSPWTGKRKVSGLPGGEIWYATATVEDIATEEEERQWRAFLMQLRGQQNTFNLLVGCQSHLGSKPQVRSGANSGYTVPLDGMQASTTILLAGQHMTIPLPNGHNRLVQLTADLTANASGEAVASFGPALNQTPAENATVETQEPFLPVAQTNSRNGLSYSQGVSGFPLDLEEAFQ